jgi:hypothetical protein
MPMADSFFELLDFPGRGRISEAYWLECCDIANTVILGDIINCNTSAQRKSTIGKLFHPFECPIPCSVIQHRCPIIAEVFTESATRTI